MTTSRSARRKIAAHAPSRTYPNVSIASSSSTRPSPWNARPKVRAKLFHTIVVVGLSSASAACGPKEATVARATDAGKDSASADAADDDASDATPVTFGASDAADEPVVGIGNNAPDAAIPCVRDASPSCWPIYV